MLTYVSILGAMAMSDHLEAYTIGVPHLLLVCTSL